MPEITVERLLRPIQGLLTEAACCTGTGDIARAGSHREREILRGHDEKFTVDADLILVLPCVIV